jgi:hypothetical protein
MTEKIIDEESIKIEPLSKQSNPQIEEKPKENIHSTIKMKKISKKLISRRKKKLLIGKRSS